MPDWAAEYARLLLGYEGDWRLQGLCRDLDDALFFPERGNSGQKALAYCSQCPVCAECLEFALGTEQEHGIWGGKTATEREVMVEMRHAQAELEKILKKADDLHH